LTTIRCIVIGVVAIGIALVILWKPLYERWDEWRHDGITHSGRWVPPGATCDPDHVRRQFRMEKTRFLLGEPILVEFKIGVDGPGGWENWRWGFVDGRDVDFAFLLRHDDGTWVPDRYKPRLFSGGGAFRPYDVSRESSDVYWLVLQQYCAITRPC